MPAQQLLDYIKQALQQGANQADIRNALLSAGWRPQDVEEALVAAETQRRTEARKEEVPVSPVSELPGPTALLREAQAIFTKRLGTFVGVMLIPVLIEGLAVVAVVGVALLMGLSPSSPEFVAALADKIWLAVLLLGLFSITSVVITLWSQTALLYAIKDHEEKIGVRESYRRGWHKIRSYLWVNILIGFISFGGFLLFVVPEIIFSIWFIFAPFIVIAEELGGMAALLKSREYVRGRWWGVVGRFLFFVLFVFVTVIPIIVLEVLGVPLIPDLGEIGASLFLTPLTMIYGFVIYKYLRALKGEFAFTPSRRSRAGFLLVGLLGPLFIIGAIVFVLQFSQKLGLGSPAELIAKTRDLVRAGDQVTIQTALEEYHTETGSYPPSLDQLVPEYLISISLDATDPGTGLPYEYKAQADGKDYQLCIDFEVKPRECVTSTGRGELLELQPYVNKKAGFKIRPPGGWQTDESGMYGFLVMFLSPVSDEGVSEASIGVVTDSSYGLSLEEYVSQSKRFLLESEAVQDYTLLEDRKVTIGGRRGHIIGGSFTEAGIEVRNRQLVVIGGGKAYIVTATSLESAWGKYKDLFEASFMTLELL